VYWQYTTTTTDATGAYAISVSGDQSVVLVATGPALNWQSATGLGATLAADTVNYDLLFQASSWVTPSQFTNVPQQTITVTGWTAAPQATSRVVAHASFAPTVDLTYQPSAGTDGAGESEWQGTLLVPAGQADGSYSVTVCAVDQGTTNAGATCSLANPGFLSNATVSSFVIDSTPPAVTSTAPVANGNVGSTAPVSASIRDDGVGVDIGSVAMKIDGAAIQPTITPGNPLVLAWSSTSKAPGVHTAEVDARDWLGNVMPPFTWSFTVVAISAPDWVAFNVPTISQPLNYVVGADNSKVTFHNVVGTLDSYPVGFTAISGVGTGSNYRRTIDWSNSVFVHFNNGVVSATVPLTSTPAGVTNKLGDNLSWGIALPTPYNGYVVAHIPKTTVAMGDITVRVPPAFQTPGVTVTLQEDADARETPLVSPSTILDSALNRKPYVLSVGISDWVAYTDTSNSASFGGGSETGADPTLNVTLQEQGTTTSRYVLVPLDQNTFPGVHADGPPNVTCDDGQSYTGLATNIPCLYGGGFLASQTAWYTVPNTSIGLYGNHWIGRSSTTDEFIDFHQVAVNVGDFACPQGNTTQSVPVSVNDFRTEAEQVGIAPDQTSLWDVFHFTAAQSSFGGHDLRWAADYLSLNTQQGFTVDPDARYNTNDYQTLSSSTKYPVYTSVEYNADQTAPVRNTTKEMWMGTKFNLNPSYQYQPSHWFSVLDNEGYQLTLDYTAC
jgi:hypothetical protein